MCALGQVHLADPWSVGAVLVVGVERVKVLLIISCVEKLAQGSVLCSPCPLNVQTTGNSSYHIFTNVLMGVLSESGLKGANTKFKIG